MKRRFFLLILSIVMLASSCARSGSGFVTVRDGHFYLDDKPYYYVGTNFWYGAILGSTGKGGDRDRLAAELDTLHACGLDNLRILVGGDGPDGVPSRIEPTLQKEPGQYNDEIFDGLDYLLMEMGKRGMKAVLYINNSWEWTGGYSQYLEWAGEGKAPVPSIDGWDKFNEFVSKYASCQKAHELYYAHVKNVITRINRYTGLKYRDDPAIMAWQIGNEPRPFGAANKEAFIAWLSEASALIRSLDGNHLISTGNEGRAGSDEDMDIVERINADPNISYMTIHIWPYNWSWISKDDMFGKTLAKAEDNTRDYISLHRDIAGKLGKPIVLEEFGYPRDGFSFAPGSPTTARDDYFGSVFAAIADDMQTGGPFAGCNFWGWGGFAEPSAEHIYWEEGDDYTGDPAQEEQGLNSIFACDSTTLSIIKNYSNTIRNSK